MAVNTVQKAPSDTQSRRPACVACSKAKRRCTKEAPACHRCRTKGIRCDYPTTRILVFPSAEASSDGIGPARVDNGTGNGLVDVSEDSDEVGNHISRDGWGQIRAEFLERPWFLQASSWEIDRYPAESNNTITYINSGLDFFIDQARIWMDQWTRENQCPFIHSRLYNDDLPSHLQHAYAAWLTYKSAITSKNKRIALQMATDWAKDTLAKESMFGGISGASLDTLAHLSRTQALIVFQLIGLFDGDVRARAHAEATSRVMVEWAGDLIESAMRDVTASLPGQSQSSPGTITLRCSPDGNLDSAWKAWALSESIRRTWIVANLLEAAFLIQKQGFAMCPGSIGFTGKNGMWNATSPHEWLTSLQARSTANTVVFCRGLDRLLANGKPSDVDEFARALLMYGNGREMVEDWLASQVQGGRLGSG